MPESGKDKPGLTPKDLEVIREAENNFTSVIGLLQQIRSQGNISLEEAYEQVIEDPSLEDQKEKKTESFSQAKDFLKGHAKELNIQIQKEDNQTS